ncbi:MAG: DUF3857 domain-containing protein [Ferruginibacter sp.]
MKSFLIALFFLIGGYCSAQDYAVSLISDSIKQNADAVKRSDELKVIIRSPSSAIVRRRYAITILNEAGADEAVYENYYNKMQSLENISGQLYDAAGRQIKSVKKKDISDYSANDESSLMTDSRMKRHNFYYSVYPYTVEYEDEQQLDGIFFLPAWQPAGGNRISVEQSRFIVEAPEDFALRYKQNVFTAEPLTGKSGNKKTYTWEVKNLRAFEAEAYDPAESEITPSVYIAPSQFGFGDYKGDMSSWLSLGKFINELNKGRQQLPENVKQDVRRLTEKLTDPREKINVLYDYLQKNTRYISVQMGIGSWQPFDANYVATKKYGDCKALSNYMISLLTEAGITANYVIITSGENRKGLNEDFPSPYFNHAIVCVPGNKDTLWLECTSQTVSAGYMGNHTGNRKALLIDAAGGHIVQTPVYKASDNLQIRRTDAVINEQGGLSAKVYTHFTGQQQDQVHSLIHGADEKQKLRYLNRTLSLPTYTVEKYEYKETKGMIPVVDEYLSITSPNYAIITGQRLFLTPNFFNRSSSKLPVDEKRKQGIEFPLSFIDVDSLHISIPANYEPEAMPKTVNIKNEYGSYSISFTVKGNTIDVLRKNELNRGLFPKSKYPEIAEYFNSIYRADRSKIVLVKKNN